MSDKKPGSKEEAARQKAENDARFREIREVLSRNKITRGVSPEKLRVILEELGPTYIKLGQIMSLHSDILPKAYCDELMKLNSDVTPMPFSEVEEVIKGSFREPWDEVFESVDRVPLGSASIAQVHRAKLRQSREERHLRHDGKGHTSHAQRSQASAAGGQSAEYRGPRYGPR